MKSVDEAFHNVSRADFLLEDMRQHTTVDVPLPIGFGQTNSQPYTVRKMLEWLDAKPAHKVLDLGSGSGWTTALLSCIVGEKGNVYAVERIPELVRFGRNNCRRIGTKNTKFYQSGQTIGLPQHAPYDRILVSAFASQIPTELLNQLKINGKMVIPVKNDILEITKNSDGIFDTKTHPGFVFVPLIQ